MGLELFVVLLCFGIAHAVVEAAKQAWTDTGTAARRGWSAGRAAGAAKAAAIRNGGSRPARIALGCGTGAVRGGRALARGLRGLGGSLATGGRRGWAKGVSRGTRAFVRARRWARRSPRIQSWRSHLSRWRSRWRRARARVLSRLPSRVRSRVSQGLAKARSRVRQGRAWIRSRLTSRRSRETTAGAETPPPSDPPGDGETPSPDPGPTPTPQGGDGAAASSDPTDPAPIPTPTTQGDDMTTTVESGETTNLSQALVNAGSYLAAVATHLDTAGQAKAEAENVRSSVEQMGNDLAAAGLQGEVAAAAARLRESAELHETNADSLAQSAERMQADAAELERALQEQQGVQDAVRGAGDEVAESTSFYKGG